MFATQVSRREAPVGRTELVGEETEWSVLEVAGKPSLVETTGHNSNGENNQLRDKVRYFSVAIILCFP